MEWNDDLATGIEKIDMQHKELIRLINQVLDACRQRRGKEVVGETLKFLEDYVQDHFETEEKMQKEHKYPELNSHIILHREFIENFSKIKEQFEKEGASISVITSLNKTLVYWLMKHIKGADKAFAEFLKTEH